MNSIHQKKTTFKHRKTQQCQVWEVIEQGHDKLKLHLLFNTSPANEDYMLSGPASGPNMAIMYTCQKGNCVIAYPCIVCCNLSPDCRKMWQNNPCTKCSVQCFNHHIDVPRKFNPLWHGVSDPGNLMGGGSWGPTAIFWLFRLFVCHLVSMLTHI